MNDQHQAEIPDWCGWGVGSSKVLILAPHGGAKSHPETIRIPSRGDKAKKINDLHTVDMSESLIASLDASYILNRGIDRNQLDLNRISQVRRKASWYLTLLGHLLEMIVRRHGEAHVLVVHGWNVNQARCDIGVGANLDEESTDLSRLTVSTGFTDRYLRRLIETAAPEHRVTLGRRYPARHRNNMLQLFRRDGSRCDDLPSVPHSNPMAEIVRAGKCEAVQLELGIPMRWPGSRRDDFTRRLIEVFRRDDTSTESSTSNARASTRSRPAVNTMRSVDPHPRTLQAFDPSSRVAVLASLDRLPGTDSCFGRVALFLPDGSVGLYTGEARSPLELATDGPSFRADDHALHLEFEGAVLVTPNGADYVDLERALDRSILADTRIQLVLSASEGAASGHVGGAITVGERELEVDTTGFSTPRQWGAWRSSARAHWNVRAAFAGRSPISIGSASRRPEHTPTESARILIGDDQYAPEELSATTSEHTLRVRPLARMSIARPIGPLGRRARVTFGPAEVQCSDSEEAGFGLYEYARLIDR